jgi:hypothetical protein
MVVEYSVLTTLEPAEVFLRVTALLQPLGFFPQDVPNDPAGQTQTFAMLRMKPDVRRREPMWRWRQEVRLELKQRWLQMAVSLDVPRGSAIDLSAGSLTVREQPVAEKLLSGILEAVTQSLSTETDAPQPTEQLKAIDQNTDEQSKAGEKENKTALIIVAMVGAAALVLMSLLYVQ